MNLAFHLVVGAACLVVAAALIFFGRRFDIGEGGLAVVYPAIIVAFMAFGVAALVSS